MPKYFIKASQINNNKITIIDEDANHISKVLRARIDDEIILNSQDGYDYYCKINEINKKNVVCELIKKETIKTEPDINVTLFQGVPKANKIEVIIEKSVELGVFNIVPVITKYVDYNQDNFYKKLSRYEKIAESAAKQSMRGIIPVVNNIVRFDKVLEQIKNFDKFFICYEKEKQNPLKEVLAKELNLAKNIGIFIGPEGGFDKKEVEEVLKNGGVSISLGERILRTETAGMMFMSAIMYETGNV